MTMKLTVVKDEVVRPLLRYHGGKWRLAPWIISFFPDHRIYTEAYGGAASVLLRKKRSYAEVYNDLDGEIVNLFRVLRNPAQARELIRLVALTPFAREEFEAGCAEELRTLVLCEGELNAISIWQMVEPWNWDVLSLGSESAKLTTAMIAYAEKFERVIVWMDRPELVKELMACIGGAYGIHSAVVDGVKQDANKLLQTEQLGGLLVNMRYLACKTVEEKRRLFYNVNDAIATRHMDLGACEVAMQIAGELGIKL